MITPAIAPFRAARGRRVPCGRDRSRSSTCNHRRVSRLGDPAPARAAGSASADEHLSLNLHPACQLHQLPAPAGGCCEERHSSKSPFWARPRDAALPNCICALLPVSSRRFPGAARRSRDWPPSRSSAATCSCTSAAMIRLSAPRPRSRPWSGLAARSRGSALKPAQRLLRGIQVDARASWPVWKHAGARPRRFHSAQSADPGARCSSWRRQSRRRISISRRPTDMTPSRDVAIVVRLSARLLDRVVGTACAVASLKREALDDGAGRSFG